MLYLHTTFVPVIDTLVISETKRQGHLCQRIFLYRASGIFALLPNFVLKLLKHCLFSFYTLYYIGKRSLLLPICFSYRDPSDIVCKLRECQDSII